MDGGFDDIEFLHDISQEDLRAIGITKVGHQRKILMAAKNLEQRGKHVGFNHSVDVIYTNLGIKVH